MKLQPVLTVLVAGTLFGVSASAQTAPQPAADPLADGFRNPPDSARPRVWWHWMNGNVTEEGVRLDLEWMRRIGLGGVQTFDAALSTPQIVKNRLAYMTPEWKQAFALSVQKARSLGLEYAIPSAPGWSETGGPWVKPEDGMKKLAWSVTDVTGGERGPIRLASPPTTTGLYQMIPADASNLPSLYRDVKVLAFPATPDKLPAPRGMKSAEGAIDPTKLMDGDLATPVEIAPAGKPGWVLIDYGRPQSIRSARIAFVAEHSPLSGVGIKLEASDDGVTFRPVAEDTGESFASTTFSFAPVTARYFRVTLAVHSVVRNDLIQGAAPGFTLEGLPFGSPPKPVTVGEVALSDASAINRGEAKAGFSTVENYLPLATPAAVGGGVDPARVIDLTSKLRPDGTLDWRPPVGSWRIVRLGWSLTGTENHPATAEATGLEVDKLDPGAVKRYADAYLKMISDAGGPLGKDGIGALLNDSTETGPQNWTSDMIGEFTRRRGYDPTPWLPALTGVVVGDPARSDTFLSDYRRTLGELQAEVHYRGMAEAAHARGMIHYSEAMENGRPTFGDDMEMRRFADVPMAAMWAFRRNQQPAPVYLADVRGAASTAHVYGKKLVAAESMTSALAPWSYAPAELKRVIDQEFAAGVNLPVIHDSAHQPNGEGPGLSLSIFGQFFNRNETWAEQARPWIDYIARTSYLLQQGRFAADIAYFYGDDAPLTAIFKNKPVADLPAGYAYDFVGGDAVANQLSVKDGQLVTSSGMSYRLLQLAGGDARMTLATLRHIRALVKAGATVAGPKPLPSASLTDPQGEFDSIVAALWDGAEGKGRVFATADAALAAMRTTRDVDAEGLHFVHRVLPDGDLYFLSNPGAAREIQASFRVASRQPELWSAETGASAAVSWRIENGRTIVPLHLGADDAVFVLFRHPTTKTSETVTQPARTDLMALDNGWTLSFQTGRGAPASPVPATTGSFAVNADPAIKYFSGTASYRQTIDVPAAWTRRHLWLDLGQVGDIAEVIVNGKPARTLWRGPYAAEIGPLLKSGRNMIEIRVTNLWTNRLIGDVQHGATKIGKVYIPTFRPDAPLRPAGLIGPVKLSAE